MSPLSLAGRSLPRSWRLLPVLLPLAIFVGTGLRGLDFGQHWDERHYQIDPMATVIRTGRPLPGYYGYPSLDYWISAGALIPDAIVEAARGPGARERLLDRINTHGFLLRLRVVYLVICALTVLWIYLLVIGWRNSIPEALLAATTLATSWEVAYHSRWIATDGVLMQFGALTMLLVMSSRRRSSPGPWLLLAAVTAGLGAGTKYPGALLLTPVLIGGWLAWRPRHRPAVVLAGLAGLAGVAFVTFVASTPALVLRPGDVVDGMVTEIRHYGYGHYGHTVHPGLGHLLRMGLYLGTALFSWYGPIAMLLGALCLVGTWSLRKDAPTAALLLSFPAVYVLYFSSQRAMVVRNLLVVAPFLAILAAHGAAALWQRLNAEGEAVARSRAARAAGAALAALLTGAVLVDAAWLWHAATTIRERHSDRFVREALTYVGAHAATTFYLSPRVATHFALIGAHALPNVTAGPDDAEHVMFYAHEGVRHYQDWRANRLRLTERWFGPYEVNFNVYPNWWGDDRIVVMSMAKAKHLGLLVAADGPR